MIKLIAWIVVSAFPVQWVVQNVVQWVKWCTTPGRIALWLGLNVLELWALHYLFELRP